MTANELRNIGCTGRADDLSGFGEWEMQNFIKLFKPKLVAVSHYRDTDEINGILVEDDCGFLSAVIGVTPALKILGDAMLGEGEKYYGEDFPDMPWGYWR